MTKHGDITDIRWLFTEARKYKYISFDIYDTLLLRPYVKPRDLFKHIEKFSNAPGFANARIRAEHLARDKWSGETTFANIYETIDPKYAHLKRTELEFEMCAFCLPEVRDAFNALCKKREVYLISDMYLPKRYLEHLLKLCGLEGYTDLYVSCEHNCSKGSGKLFKRMLAEKRIHPDDIIHFGDNIHSDYRVPRSLGIYCANIRRPIDNYLRKHPLIHKFYLTNRSVERSMIVSFDMIHSYEKGNDPWYDIAYRFGGPLLLDYVRFIEKNRDKDSVLFFIARDGYNLKQFYDSNITDENLYVYASRILNILIGSNYKNYKGYQEVLVKYFYPDYNGDPYVFFEENKVAIKKKRKELFSTYANTFGDHKKITLVDVTTMKYSSQRLMNDIYPDADIKGLYYFILDDDTELPHEGYHVRDKIVKLGDNINITEFFLTSPEPPIDGIDPNGEPIFREPAADEMQRMKIYDHITRGELSYYDIVRDLFPERMIDLGYDNIRAWLKVLTCPLNKSTRKMLTDMKWPVDAKHETYISMVYHPRDTWYHLRKTVLDSMWYILKRLKMKGE